MVDQLIGRIPGRPVHGDAERRAWSIVIGKRGYKAFVDELLTSDEYMHAFGYDHVPSQRSRLLPGRDIGERPIYQSFPRYEGDWRDTQRSRAPSPDLPKYSINSSSIKFSDQDKRSNLPALLLLLTCFTLSALFSTLN